MTSVVPWGDMTEAEQAGLIQRTAKNMLGSPSLRECTPEQLRREDPADSFTLQLADAIEAELAAREARKQLRVVSSARWCLPPPGGRSGAPRLRVVDGYAPSPFAVGITGANRRRKPRRR